MQRLTTQHLIKPHNTKEPAQTQCCCTQSPPESFLIFLLWLEKYYLNILDKMVKIHYDCNHDKQPP